MCHVRLRNRTASTIMAQTYHHCDGGEKAQSARAPVRGVSVCVRVRVRCPCTASGRVVRVRAWGVEQAYLGSCSCSTQRWHHQ